MVAGAAVQKMADSLAKEQEILMHVADMLIQTYYAESMSLRVEKLVSIKGEDQATNQVNMMKVYVHDAADHIHRAGKEALMGFVSGDELRMMLMGLKRFTKLAPFNTKEARRAIAQEMIDANDYVF